MTHPSINELVQTAPPNRDLVWLKQSLQSAIELEFFTIPPYLTALWSIKDSRDPVATSIREVALEEMLHMSLVCNMLKAVGGEPMICDAGVAPQYPDYLPGGVKPGLKVALTGLSKQSLQTFMAIEEPEQDISFLEAATETFPRIGSFYDAIEEAFYAICPELTREGQVEGYFGESQQPGGVIVPKNIGTLPEVSAAIKLIRDQGEGTSELVLDSETGELAHYYRFKEIAVGRKIIRSEGRWVHQGVEVPMPDSWQIGQVPPGGFAGAPPAVEEMLDRFDVLYTRALKQLQIAWSRGDQGSLHRGLELMMDEMPTLARRIMAERIDEQPYHYAPCFRFVPEEAN